MSLNKDSLKRYGNNISKNVKLSNYSWFNLGGPAEYFYKPENKKQLIEFLKEIRKEDLNIIQVTGSEEEAEDLLNFALELQKTLNLGDKSILSIEHKGSGFMEAIDSQGRKYSFTKKDFRAQLERLEHYILFELSSGSIDNIRYIDLRYKNALAVGYKNMEKTI